jgi:hypothetical protein
MSLQIQKLITSLINSIAYLCERCNGGCIGSSNTRTGNSTGSNSDAGSMSDEGNNTNHYHANYYSTATNNGTNTTNGTNTYANTNDAEKPTAGCTTVQLPYDASPENVLKTVYNHQQKQYQQYQQQQQQIKIGWMAAPSSTINVRGAHYLNDKIKIPSPTSLYELVEVDVLHADDVILDIGQKFNLSKLYNHQNEHANEHGKTWHAPNFLIISFLLPTSAPKIGQKSNEKGYIVTGYYKLRDETKQILSILTHPKYNNTHDNDNTHNNTNEHLRIDALNQFCVTGTSSKSQSKPQSKSQSQSPHMNQKDRINAVKLWEKWCTNAPHDPEMQKRLKFIPRGNNLREIGVANWICKYNGKPMLIKRPGVTNFVFSHDVNNDMHNDMHSDMNMMEIDVNMHPLPYLFKSAMHHLDEHYFQNLLMSFAFLIEGREEDELPETLLGCPLNVPTIHRDHILKATHVFGTTDSYNSGSTSTING